MKRPRGTGSLFKRGRIWFIQYFHNGRHRESSGSDDRKMAEALLRKRLGEIATGTYLGLAVEKVTMGQLIDLVIEDCQFRELRAAQSVVWRAAAHFDEAFRKQSAAKFSIGHVKRYVTERRTVGAADATINRELAIIRRGFKLGRQSDPPLVQREPYIQSLKEDNVRVGFLEPEGYERLLAELPDRLKALFVCAYHVGTRKGELLQLRWEQIDWDAKLIRLERGQTKTKKPRTLPIYGEMERWLRTQQETNIPGCPWVFHWLSHRVGAALKGWRNACERADVPGLLFHDLRRSAARNLRRAGVPQDIAMAITGHTTDRMWRRYDIIDEADIDSAGETMERFFEKRKQDRAAKLERIK